MFSTWASGLTSRRTRRSSQQQPDPPARRRSSQLVAASPEDVNHLQLTPAKVRVLKKTLFYFSRLYTEIRDHDIFVVSWDVHNVPKPPDDLSAVLPPESWEEPEIIVLGLRNILPEFLDAWISICDASVADYALEFQPLTNKPLIESGTLLLIYAKSFVLPYVQTLDTHSLSSTFSAVACRFSLHQAPLCIVNLDFNDSIVPTNDIARQTTEELDDGKDSDPVTRGASQRQQFKTLIDRMQFDIGGRVYGIPDHPVVLLLGCKDTALDNDDFDTDNVASKNHRVQYPILKRLKSFDLRFSPNISGQLGVRKFRGALDVVKAGVMRLVMEVDGGEGSRTAAPEVSMLRVGVPSVDSERLRHLYRTVWRSLKNGEEESAAVQVEPPIIEHPSIRPFVPSVLKFTIRNTNKTPAAFSVLCLSGSGRNLVPVSTHSLLHRAKIGQSHSLSPPKSPHPSERLSARTTTSSADEQISETASASQLQHSKSDATAMSIALDLQKKFMSFKKKADKNLHGMLTRRSMSTSTETCNRASKYLSLPDPEEGVEDLGKGYSTLSIPGGGKTTKQSKGWWGKLGWGKPSSSHHHEGHRSGTDTDHSDVKRQETSFSSPRGKTGESDGTPLTDRSSGGKHHRSNDEVQGFDDTGWKTHRGGGFGVSMTSPSILSSPGTPESTKCTSSSPKSLERRRGSQTITERPECENGDDEMNGNTGPVRRLSDNDDDALENHVTNHHTDHHDGQNEFEQREDHLNHQSATSPVNTHASPSAGKRPNVSIRIPQIEIPKQRYNPFDEQRSPSYQRKDKQFDLSRWVFVEPAEGVVLGGNEIEISITILVKEGMTKTAEVPSLILAVRLDNCKFDSFFSLSTKVVPSLHGLSLGQLEMLGYEPFRRPKADDTTHELLIPYEEEPPEGQAVIPRKDRHLPVPKELWWILSEIYERTMTCTSETLLADGDRHQTFEQDREFRLTDFLNKSGQGLSSLSSRIKSQMKIVMTCIETGAKVPRDDVPTIALLLALEKWAIELPIPIMPRECVTELNHDPSHLLCRAVLLSLPMWTRNLFIAILSLCRHLIRREIAAFHANEALLNTAIVEWLSRFLLRDTRPDLSIPFLTHFMDDSNIFMFNE